MDESETKFKGILAGACCGPNGNCEPQKVGEGGPPINDPVLPTCPNDGNRHHLECVPIPNSNPQACQLQWVQN
jgi:hypothetical protein